MSKKKICFIAQFPPPIHGLSKAVDTLFNSKLNSDIDTDGEFEFEKIDITNNRKIISNLIAIRKSKADLFYFTISQTKGGNFRDLAIFRAIGNRSCLVHLHGGYYRTMVDQLPAWQRKANYKAIGKLAGAIVLGPSLKWIFQGMVPDEKIYTVSNCVDDEYLMPGEVFEEKIRMIDHRKIRHVLYLSNFIRSKGYRKVLEFARLEKERVDAGGVRKLHFEFAGKFFDSSEEEFYNSFVKNNSLERYITYHGTVEGAEKMELLKNCDIFCLLTTYPNEGQPISIIEAMGNGMVIVTTDHAGIPDLVEDGKNGIVVDKYNIDVKKIYDNVINLKSFYTIALSNRKKIEEKFNQAVYLSGMKKCFLIET